MVLLYTEGGNHPRTGESTGSGDRSGDGDVLILTSSHKHQ